MYMISHFSLDAFKILCLPFNNLTIICLGMDLFKLILLEFIELLECVDFVLELGKGFWFFFFLSLKDFL